jgi:hypothetical protein
MRRLSVLILVAIGLALIHGALPASAQNIVGLSLRPQPAAPSGAARGSADIVENTGGGYKVSADLSSNADTLKLQDYQGSNAFVLWAVDMDGQRHNLGALGKDLTLKDVAVAYTVAKLYVTAEPDPKAEAPTGQPLYQATLRNVTEVEAPTAAATEAATETAATAAPTAEATAVAAATTTTPAKPSELPTTGSTAQDLAILAAIAMVLLLLGLRLRTVRV